MEGFESNEKMSCFIAPFIMFSFYDEFGNTSIYFWLKNIPFVSGNIKHLQCAVSLTSSNGTAGNVSLVGTFGTSAAAVCV